MEWFVDHLRTFGDKPAIAEGDKVSTYAQLCDRIDAYSRQIADQGIERFTTVGLVADYSFDSIALFFALALQRAVVVPMTIPPGYDGDDRLTDACVDVVVGCSGDMTVAPTPQKPGSKHPLIQRLQDKGHAGLVLFSSGSVGKPKAMLHDLDALVDGQRGRPARDSIILVFLMFDHIGGMHTLLSFLAMGAMLVIPGRRDPDDVCALIAKHRVQILPASPTFLNLVLISEAHRRHDVSSIRLVTYGTEPMPETLLARLAEIFPGAKCLQTFGTSETGIAKTVSHSSASTLMKIDDPLQEYRIVDGELWLRSQTQILGYLNADMDSFTADGWFRTGDLVETAADGYLRIVGRRKEIINVGGQKVLPAEIESALLAAPGIEDCLAYGEANALTGQTVAVDVVLREPKSALDAKREIRLFLKGKLEPYKIPTRVQVVDRTNFNERFKKIRRKDAPIRRG